MDSETPGESVDGCQVALRWVNCDSPTVGEIDVAGYSDGDFAVSDHRGNDSLYWAEPVPTVRLANRANG